ncbi:MAG: STAS/SEC14 domain-containing protein [Pirellulales bacterium]|nr:STAS/SEC14 domain-containing protein [Pirellulales bacterium]
MSVSFHTEADGRVIHVHANGKLTKQDYQHFVPEFEKSIEQNGKIRVLFEMEDFHGWQAGALWEDLKFDLKHFKDIERVAMVGDRAWEKGMSIFCKPFTTAKVRYFDQRDSNQAQEWINEGILTASKKC